MIISKISLAIAAILLSAPLFSQSINTGSVYNSSMAFYKAGKFKTLPEKEGLRVSGVLNSLTEKKYTLALPIKVEGNKVIGETYQIEHTAIRDNKNLKKIALVLVKDSDYTTKNGCRLFIYDFKPEKEYASTIFILSGITGINHTKEQDIIQLLSNNQNRVVVIHPRGTGYSEGTRGDIHNFDDFINDYVEVITHDPDYISKQHNILLYGHSMSTAVALAVADKVGNIGGVILVNPPYKLKKAKGMSPDFGQYVKYAFYSVFARHKPVVNMAGDPSKIEDPEDRADAESRIGDPLLVSHFSLYYMLQSRKLMNSMVDYSRTANYPLLLIYGEKDNIVDKKGCNILFDTWKCANKQYALVENGYHGKSTVLLSKDAICRWIDLTVY